MTISQFPLPEGGIPTGTTAQRPSSPVTGDVFYNGTLSVLEIYDGTNWVPCSAPAAAPSISVADIGTNIAYGSAQGTVTITEGTVGGPADSFLISASTGGYTATTSGTTVNITVGNPGSWTFSAQGINKISTSVAGPSTSATLTTVPQAPTIGTATTTGTTTDVSVSWTLNNNGGKNLTAITITPYLNGTTAQTPTTAATTTATSATVSGLTQGSSYTFRVKATNANGDSLESSATGSITIPTLVTIDFLVVAGGGKGGDAANSGGDYSAGGGGGAGGLRSSTSTTGGNANLESPLSIGLGLNATVTVGAGGGDSIFSNITSTAGGAGGNVNSAGANGGSGGGAGNGGNTNQGTNAAGNGTTGQGFGGGGGYNNPNQRQQNTAGGGGGAGAAGGTGGQGGQNFGGGGGGSGRSNDITGTGVFRSGGGGGAPGGGATTNNGGGGRGATPNYNADAGTANTGGGGGGGWYSTNATKRTGANGGSGIVILRYPSSRTISVGAGLTSTTNTVGNNKVTAFTAGTGNVSFS